ncbi:molecular chaperone [Lacibacterium aquatile]|uniref:Molecular chaperone n=1 Tax=Lacibacterium aquatile TaxID=1168082 RepID=A0ABW5DSX5_9PROT
MRSKRGYVRIRLPIWGFLLFLGAVLALGDPAMAGQLKLSTVRIDLSDRQPSAVLTLTNTGPSRSLVHLRLMAWSQVSGADRLEPTDAVLVNPPIADILPGAQQVVRIGYAGALQTPNERTFRLFIEEVPLQDSTGAQAVETILKISLPVFLPPQSPPTKVLAAAPPERGIPTVFMLNRGTRHARFTEYQLIGRGGVAGSLHKTSGYVLASTWMGYPLDDKDLAVPGPEKLRLTTEDGPVEIPLDPAVRQEMR